MKGAIALRKPVGTPIANDNSGGGTIATAAYTQVLAATTAPASAIEVFNTSSKAIKLALGDSGKEVDLPYWVPPGAYGQIIPVEIKNGVRVTAKALSADATTGFLVVNFLA